MRGSHRYYSPKGMPIVLFAVDVPDNFVLLSDFEMWNTISNHGYLAVDTADYEYYTAAGEKSIYVGN